MVLFLVVLVVVVVFATLKEIMWDYILPKH